MEILSFNVRQWNRDTDSTSPYYWKNRMAAMEKMINELSPDILCFQEMLIPVEYYIPSNYERVNVSVSHPIYLRKGLKYSNHKFQIHAESIIVTDELGMKIQVINVHSHWNEKIIAKNIKQIDTLLNDDNVPIVICGDFNNSLETINEFGGIKGCQSAREMLGISEDEYTFEHFTKEEQKYTIDHFFVKNIIPLEYKLIKEDYGVKRMSDHYPIMMKF